MTNECVIVDNFLVWFTFTFLKLWPCDSEGKNKVYDRKYQATLIFFFLIYLFFEREKLLLLFLFYFIYLFFFMTM